jgi:hypothetical protein
MRKPIVIPSNGFEDSNLTRICVSKGICRRVQSMRPAAALTGLSFASIPLSSVPLSSLEGGRASPASQEGAAGTVGAFALCLQIPSSLLFTLDRFEESFEISYTEAGSPAALDEFEKHRRAILKHLGKRLE